MLGCAVPVISGVESLVIAGEVMTGVSSPEVFLVTVALTG